MVESEE